MTKWKLKVEPELLCHLDLTEVKSKMYFVPAIQSWNMDGSIHTTPNPSAVELSGKLMLFAGYSFQGIEKAGRDLAGRAREKADLIQKAIKIASTNQ